MQYRLGCKMAYNRMRHQIFMRSPADAYPEYCPLLPWLLAVTGACQRFWRVEVLLSS